MYVSIVSMFLSLQVVGVIRDEILPYSRHMPEEFVIHIMKVLNKGSIHSATSSAFIGKPHILTFVL